MIDAFISVIRVSPWERMAVFVASVACISLVAGCTTTNAVPTVGIAPGTYNLELTGESAANAPDHQLVVSSPAETTNHPYEFEIKTRRDDDVDNAGAIALSTAPCPASSVVRTGSTVTITLPQNGGDQCATFVVAEGIAGSRRVIVSSGTVVITFSNNGDDIAGSISLTTNDQNVQETQRTYAVQYTGNKGIF